jgi:hypothetical protein
MATLLKTIGPENITYSEELVRADLNTISGTDLTFYKVSKTGTTYSHLWRGPLVDIPTTDKEKTIFETLYSQGGLSGTSMEYWVTNVGDNIIVADIDSSVFDVAIDGLNFRLTIPLDSTYTGATSGLSSTNLYGSYMRTNLYDQKNNTGPCSCAVMDYLLSEQDAKATINVGQGLPVQNGTNPDPNYYNYYHSGIVYLFSDDIKKPNVTGTTMVTTNSWATGFGEDCPYSQRNKFPFNYVDDTINGYYVDQPVGAVDLLGGQVKIFNQDLVEAFDFTTASSGNSLTGATFPSSGASATFKSYDLDQGLNITILANRNEFTTSNNPTYDPISCDGKLYITSIDLYDSQGRLVAKALPDAPIEKSKDSVFVSTLNVKF